jgi:hypothetical protein
MTFTIKVWYAATGEDDPPQEHRGLTSEQVETGMGAFVRDLTGLEGRGVRRVTLEVEGE